MRADVPVMVGTWGPKMCRMAGGVADEEAARERRSTGRGVRDHQHRVVAGDGTQDLPQPGAVERRGDHVGRTGRRAHHDDGRR